MKNDYDPKREWQITCTEEKLRLMAQCVEDINRFICGQPELMWCLHMFDNHHEIGNHLRQKVIPMMNPELSEGGSYGWTGGDCPNLYQRKQIAQGYATYKSILSSLANEYEWDNVHSGTPLTCELGGELMKIRPKSSEDDIYKEYWLCCDKDGNHTLHTEKPIWREYADGGCWTSKGWINPEMTRDIQNIFRLPVMTWGNEPLRVTLCHEVERKSPWHTPDEPIPENTEVLLLVETTPMDKIRNRRYLTINSKDKISGSYKMIGWMAIPQCNL